MGHLVGVRTALFAVLALALTHTESRAQLFVPTGRDTLRGLPGVEILIEPLQPELARDGLTQDSVVQAVTRQLKAGGVTIYPGQRENPSVSKPYLYVHVNAARRDANGDYAVAVQVHLRQTLASLTTESRIVNAMSWDAHDVLIVTPARLKDSTLGEIGDLVGVFVADWKSVH